MRKIYFKHKKVLIISLIFSTLVVSTTIGYAFLFQRLVDYIVNLDINGAIISLLFLVTIFILSSTFTFLRGYFLNKYFRNIFTDLKSKLFRSFMASDYLVFYERGEGDYLNTITTLVNDLKEEYLMPIHTVATSLLLSLFSLVAIFYFNFIMGILAIFLMLAQLAIPTLFKKTTVKTSQDYVKKSAEFTSKTSGFLGNFELIISQNFKGKIQELFLVSNKSFEESKFKRNNVRSLSNALIFLANMMLILLPWFIGAILVIEGNITFGILMAISQLNNSVAEPFTEVITAYNRAISGKQIEKKIENDLLSGEGVAKDDFVIAGGFDTLVLNNLNYSYGNTKILHDLNFTFEKNKKYALTGKSGSGKSTLGKVIIGLLKCDEGEIYVNGHVVDTQYQSTSKVIGYLPQETHLLNDTLKNNITLYGDFSEDKIQSILDKLGLSSWVDSLENGTKTLLGSSGQFVSGGQKQRIGIARMLIRDIPVIIFDEPTSSLDLELHHEIEELILSLENVTVICITHRFDAEVINKYDTILKLEDGTISVILPKLLSKQ